MDLSAFYAVFIFLLLLSKAFRDVAQIEKKCKCARNVRKIVRLEYSSKCV